MDKKIILVVGSMLLSVLTGLSLRRGGEVVADKKEDDGLVIGLSLDTLKEARWQVDRRVFVEQAERLGAKVLDLAANGDDAVQISDVEKLITNRVDALVIVPHDGKAMAKAVRMAHQAGIPVIAYDRIIRDSDLDLYISFDNVRVGELQARYLVDALKKRSQGPARIVRIYGAKTDNNAFLFKRGQDLVLDPLVESGEVVVVHEDWAEEWKPENAKRIVNAAISAHGAEFDGVLASNDGTAGGAVQALLEEGLAGDKLVTGQDAELVACQRIAAGTQAMTIYKPVQRLAERAAELAVDLARGKPVIARGAVDNGAREVPSVLLDVVTVTRENLRETVVKDGFHGEQAVFGEATADAVSRAKQAP